VVPPTRETTASGKRESTTLSLEFVDGYSASAADASDRRKQVSATTRRRIDEEGADFRDREIDVVWISRRAPT
jgi:hypothetical protein